MSKILVFQHVASEPLGVLHSLLRKAGFRIRYVNFGRQNTPNVAMTGYDGLVVLGGPMGVYETSSYPHLEFEMACIRQAVAEEKPVLGICLGAQLIASAMGATVKCGEEGEVGWCDVFLTDEGKKDPVLGTMQPTEKIFQWHGDFFQVPEGSVWLAKSESCPFQAFRLGTKVYGFQFHLEVDEKMIERWLNLDTNAHLFKDSAGEARKQKIREETEKYLKHSTELSHRVFSNYINLCNERSKLRWKKL